MVEDVITGMVLVYVHGRASESDVSPAIMRDHEHN